MPIIEAIATIEAPIVENPLPDETLSDAIAATDKPKAAATDKPKSDTDKRFTAEQAAAYYSVQSGKPLKASSLKQNAKMYGFMIKERGSGMYALIDT